MYIFLYNLKTKHWFIIGFIFKSLERIYMFGVINYRLFNLQEHMQLFCQQLFVEILPVHLFVSVCISELHNKVNVNKNMVLFCAQYAKNGHNILLKIYKFS